MAVPRSVPAATAVAAPTGQTFSSRSAKQERSARFKPSGYYMYHKVQHLQILRSTHTVYLRVLCGSENKQRLFPYTALTDWSLNMVQYS